jgi:hypothetical protein
LMIFQNQVYHSTMIRQRLKKEKSPWPGESFY